MSQERRAAGHVPASSSEQPADPGHAPPAGGWVVHPYLLAVYPALYLYARNADFVSVFDLVRPTMLSLSMAALSMGLLRLIGLDPQRRGLLVSAAMLLWGLYGALVDVGTSILPVPPRGKTLIPAYAVVLLFVAVALRRSRPGFPKATTAANVMAGVMVAVPAVQIAASMVAGGALQESRPAAPTRATGALSTATSADDPDIYYFVLDAYGSADVLRDLYDVDIDGFLGALEDRGFYVAGESRANYPQTEHSLASTLNMRYLDELAALLGPDYTDRDPLNRLLKGSEVVGSLRGRGYSFVAFATTPNFVSMENADFYIEKDAEWTTEFETSLINATAFRPFFRRLVDDYEFKRAKIRYLFERVQDLSDVPGPKFVFAHVLAPHPPFVFAADGSATALDRPYNLGDGREVYGVDGYARGYRDSVQFLNRQLIPVVDAILAGAERPVAIILQGDHGGGMTLDWHQPERMIAERFPVLNAYLLPGGGARRLYPGISPVNTFRVLYNHYFGAEYPLLPDRSYFADQDRPYVFTLVPANSFEADDGGR